MEQMKEREVQFDVDLQNAGFTLDFGPDESGITTYDFRRRAGYHIDIGGSQLIIDSQIKKAGSGAREIIEYSVILGAAPSCPPI
jgi:putative flavoprotein involved in K+ transport